MKMTIDELIAKETETAQEFQKVIDTHIISDNFSLEEMYCDDTEVIEEYLQRYKYFADYHNQIVNILQKYQKIREIVGNYGFDTSWLCLKKIREVIGSEVLEDGRN